MIPFRSLSDFIIDGFILFTILISLGYLFITKYRQTLLELNVLSAKFLLIGSCICLILEIKQLLNYWDHTYTYEQAAFGVGLFGSGWFTYYVALLFKGILPQILWIKKLRHKIWISLSLIPFLLIENYWGLLGWNHRDYIPSSYILYIDYYRLLISFIIYAFVLTIVYSFIRSKPITKTKNVFLVYLFLLLVVFPVLFLLNSNVFAFHAIPGWHITINPTPHILDIVRFIILLFVVITYYKLYQAKDFINTNIFFVHLMLTVVTILPVKYYITLIFNLGIVYQITPENIEIMNYTIAIINILFFLSQIVFFIYLYKFKNRSKI